MRPKLLLTLAVCFLVAIVACASSGNRYYSHHDHDDYWEFTEKFARDLSGIDKVSIHTVNGSIKVYIWDQNSIDIVVNEKVRADSESMARDIANEIKLVGEKKGSELVITIDYGRYKQDMNRGNRWNYSGSLEVKVPRRLSLNLHTVNGSVKSEENAGDLEVHTTNGSITLSGCGGYADLNTTNGSITIEKVGGKVDAHTTNGRIELSEVGGEVEAHTTNGSVEARLADSMTGNVKLITTNGSVDLYLGGMRDLRIIADAGSHGKVYLDIPLTISPGEYRRGFLDGTIGSGRYRVELRTTNGAIRIKAK